MPHRRRLRHQRIITISHQLAQLRPLLDEAHQAIELTLRDGYPGGSGEPVSGGGISRPVEAVILEHERVLESRIITHTDPATGEAHEELQVVGLAAIDTSLNVISAAIGEMQRELKALADRAKAGAKPEPRTNVSECRACERPVAGTPNDRLRQGYCNACRVAWQRLCAAHTGPGAPDRAAFERARRGAPDPTPEHDTQPDTQPDTPPATADPTVPSKIELTHAGVTVTLPPHLERAWMQLAAPTDDHIRKFHAAAIAHQEHLDIDPTGAQP